MRNTLLDIRTARSLPTIWQTQPLQQQFAKADDDSGDGDEGGDGGDDGQDGGDDGQDDGDEGGDGSDDDKSKGSDKGKSTGDDRDWKAQSRQNERALKKAERERQKMVDGIAHALGIKTEDVDPKALGDKYAKATDRVRSLSVENGIYRHGGEHAKTLADSRSFMRKADDLDPDDKDFDSELADLIKDELKSRGLDGTKRRRNNNGDDGKTPRAGRSGNDVGSGDDKKRQLTQKDLAKMSPREIVKAREEGRLRDLTGA